MLCETGAATIARPTVARREMTGAPAIGWQVRGDQRFDPAFRHVHFEQAPIHPKHLARGVEPWPRKQLIQVLELALAQK